MTQDTPRITFRVPNSLGGVVISLTVGATWGVGDAAAPADESPAAEPPPSEPPPPELVEPQADSTGPAATRGRRDRRLRRFTVFLGERMNNLA